MGHVIFIGAGPGAADLITLRGARLLATADVVLFDALTDPALRDLAPKARWVNVGKRGFADSTGPDHDQCAARQACPRSGRRGAPEGRRPECVRPARGRAGCTRTAGIACEVVPGVTAAIAAAAATQRPLTRRGTGRSVSLATAMTREGSVHASRSADTEVFYMAGRQLAALSRRLIAAGWPDDTPTSVVSRAGWPDQLHSDHALGDLAQASLLHAGRPMVVVVGAGAMPLAAKVEAVKSGEHRAGCCRTSTTLESEP